jgi:hypothetical protein
LTIFRSSVSFRSLLSHVNILVSYQHFPCCYCIVSILSGCSMYTFIHADSTGYKMLILFWIRDEPSLLISARLNYSSRVFLQSHKEHSFISSYFCVIKVSLLFKCVSCTMISAQQVSSVECLDVRYQWIRSIINSAVTLHYKMYRQYVSWEIKIWLRSIQL